MAAALPRHHPAATHAEAPPSSPGVPAPPVATRPATATAPAAFLRFQPSLCWVQPAVTPPRSAPRPRPRCILIERWPTLGRVCLDVGCLQSKALLHAARVVEEARGWPRPGMPFRRAGDRCCPAWPVEELGRLHRFRRRARVGLARQRKVTVIRGQCAVLLAARACGHRRGWREAAELRSVHHRGRLGIGSPSRPSRPPR